MSFIAGLGLFITLCFCYFLVNYQEEAEKRTRIEIIRTRKDSLEKIKEYHQNKRY